MFLNISFTNNAITQEIVRIFFMILQIIVSYIIGEIGYEHIVKHFGPFSPTKFLK